VREPKLMCSKFYKHWIKTLTAFITGPKTFWATSPVGLLEWKIYLPEKKSLVQIINNLLG
jgi:hypothetical protein